MNIRKVAVASIIMLALVVINVLVYNVWYGKTERFGYYTVARREKEIEKPQDAENIFRVVIEENGTVVVADNGFRIKTVGNETYNQTYILWWELDKYYEDIRFPDRALAFFVWDFEFIGFCVLVFAVSWKKRQP